MDNNSARVLFTYRSGFPDLCKSGWTTDYGWGCSVRSAQMMLANYYLKINSVPILSIPELFFDTPDAPFSIHNICKVGLTLNKKPGHWYSPSVVGTILGKLVNTITCDTDSTCEKGLWLVPLRLGVTSIAKEYRNSVMKLMALPQLVGACGGKNNSAYFFIKVIADQWFYLDPHDTRLVSTDPMEYLTSDLYSFETNKVNSSLLFGFSITCKKDLEDIKKVLSEFDFLQNNECHVKEAKVRVEEGYLLLN